MAHLDFLFNTDRQSSLLPMVDQGVMNLRVIAQEIEQVQRLAPERCIDDHRIEWRTTVVDQGQQLFETVDRCYPIVAEVVEQSLDLHSVKMLLVGDQDT